MIQALVAAGADINTADDMGNTPLHLSCKLGLNFLALKKSRNLFEVFGNSLGFILYLHVCITKCILTKDTAVLFLPPWSRKCSSNRNSTQLWCPRNYSRSSGCCNSGAPLSPNLNHIRIVTTTYFI